MSEPKHRERIKKQELKRYNEYDWGVGKFLGSVIEQTDIKRFTDFGGEFCERCENYSLKQRDVFLACTVCDHAIQVDCCSECAGYA